jgi:uncharacterized protein (TIGR02466 family)
MTQTEPRTFELFPTPVEFRPSLLAPTVALALGQRMAQRCAQANHRSAALAHSELLQPGDDRDLDTLAQALLPAIRAFGSLLLGEPLTWTIKEMWANVLHRDGHQALHNHANCFVSGVAYLSPTEGRAQTTFLRGLGGSDFKFSNEHVGVQSGPFNAQKWQAPDMQPGDVLLFPSYLLHEVPPNRGDVRITLAFNAIPHRLDSWGYQIGLHA